MSGEVRKKFQMTNSTKPNKSCSLKYALKSVPGFADVGVPHGDGDGPITPPGCLEVVRKKIQFTNLTIPNNFSYMKYAVKSVPGLAEVGVPHGDGESRAPPRCQGGFGKNFK